MKPIYRFRVNICWVAHKDDTSPGFFLIRKNPVILVDFFQYSSGWWFTAQSTMNHALGALCVLTHTFIKEALLLGSVHTGWHSDIGCVQDHGHHRH